MIKPLNEEIMRHKTTALPNIDEVRDYKVTGLAPHLSLLLAFVFLVFSSCVKRLLPTAPVTAQEDVPVVPPSFINFSVEARSEPIVNEVRKALTIDIGAGRFNESFGTRGRDRGGISAGYGAKTEGAIPVKLDNQKLLASATVHYWVDARVHPFPPATTFSCGVGESKPTVDLSVDSEFSIDKNWELVSKTTIKGTKGVPCKVSFLRRDASDLILGKFQNKLDDFAKEQDKKITAHAALRKRVLELWNEAHKPQTVSPNTYLIFNPKKIFLKDVVANNEKIRVGFEVEAAPSIHYGTIPSASTPTALGEPGRTGESNYFKLFIPISADYSAIKAQLEKTFKTSNGSPVKFPPVKNRKWIYITGVDIYGYNSRTVIRLDLGGKLHGHVYLTGNPSYDATSREIFFDDLQLSTDSESWINRKALWLMAEIPAIKEYIRKHTRAKIGAEIDNAKLEIDAFLSSEVNVDGSTLKLNGMLNDFEMMSLRADASEEKATVYFHATGELSGILE